MKGYGAGIWVAIAKGPRLTPRHWEASAPFLPGGYVQWVRYGWGTWCIPYWIPFLWGLIVAVTPFPFPLASRREKEKGLPVQNN